MHPRSLARSHARTHAVSHLLQALANGLELGPEAGLFVPTLLDELHELGLPQVRGNFWSIPRSSLAGDGGNVLLGCLGLGLEGLASFEKFKL